MKKYILIEYVNCLKSRKFKIIFFFLMILVISPFVYSCYKFYGNNLSSIRAASDMSIIQGIASSFARSTLVLLLPLLSAVIYSDSYSVEYNNGVFKNIITKIPKKQYLISKVLVNISVVFVTFFIVLSINELLTLLAFPLEGYDNNFSLPSYIVMIRENWFLDNIRSYNPYLYDWIIIFNISLSAALISTITLIICFLNKYKWLINSFIVFISYISWMIITEILKIKNFSITSYLDFPAIGNIYSLAFLIFILIALIITIFLYSIKNKNDI
ncbi:hypothetical protein [Clostridium uliginosum]|uniref:ABC-2 family transporter protein n=1 Tax=Clostridium uliginosum TaxID=119641 RepID=A0A1I1NZA6_9CLOT|nr:hypothetical protein [Clostridium uliginosum]SFD02887.1 hypothetical protein SAMN05421842_11768 [Clostridium uliginosum]